MDKDDFNFKSEWLYSELDDQSGEKYWALDNWIDKYKKNIRPFYAKIHRLCKQVSHPAFATI